MSLVHNYGTWIGPGSLDRGFDEGANVALARVSGMSLGAAENAGTRSASETFAPAFVATKRGVKFSRPSFTQRFANLALCPYGVGITAWV